MNKEVQLWSGEIVTLPDFELTKWHFGECYELIRDDDQRLAVLNIGNICIGWIACTTLGYPSVETFRGRNSYKRFPNNGEKMNWCLWLDDLSLDPEFPNRHAPKGFIPAISSAHAQKLVEELGMPSEMDLDHDLGRIDNRFPGKDDCLIFLHWLAERNCISQPPKYHVHSENPVGRERIKSFMESWWKAYQKDWLKEFNQETGNK